MNAKHQFCIKIIHCANMNIANPEDNSQKNVFYMPMGVFPLASTLNQNGFDVEIIHLDLEVNKSIEEILDFETLDAVGFDCFWTNQILSVLNTAELIKKIKPAVFTVLGGFTASFFAGEILNKFQFIDAVIKGDGEVPILELCKTLQRVKGSALKDVPNLVWRKNDSDIIFNDFSYVATKKDMEKLEFADISLLRNWESYRELCKYHTNFTPINTKPLFFLEIGRGCKYCCSFCGGNREAQKQINGRGEPVVRSTDSVISTIKKSMAFGYTCFYVCLEFDGHEEWYIELFGKIKAEKLDISLGYGSWSLPSKTFIDALSACCSEGVIEISPETADQELQKKNKDPRILYTNEDLEETLDYIGSKGNLKALLYFGYFLPYDSRKEVFCTFEFISRLYPRYSHFAEFNYENFSTDPGALLFLYPEKYDVDITVRCFGDYLDILKRNLFEKRKEGVEDLTLFKPKEMSPAEFKNLDLKIRLFNKLFTQFGGSIAFLLRETKRVDVISNYLKNSEGGWADSGKGDFTIDEVREVILDIFNENIRLNREIVDLIENEYRHAALGSKIAKVTINKEENTHIVLKNREDNNTGRIKFSQEVSNFGFE
jgi:hypothetical protein